MVTEEDLQDVASQFGVLECPDDFLEMDCCNQFQQHIHAANEIAANDCVDAYLFLRDKISGR
jgi:hypothetical protein